MIINIVNNKKEYLKKRTSLTQNKLMTIRDLKKNLFFKYDEEAIIYLMKNYNFNHQVAKIMIENMYYIKENCNEKINNLMKFKKELISNNLLTTNKIFINNLKKYKFLFDDKIISNDIKFLKEYTQGETNKYEYNKYYHKIYKLNDIEEEVIFVANEISKLLKNNININNIYIANINDKYKMIIKRIFKLYNIPINLNNDKSIFSNTLTQKFIDSNFNIKILNNNKISEKLINIINKYKNYNEIKELIISDIKNTNIIKEKFKNAINEIDLIETEIKDYEYIFIMNFNLGEIPTISKDELYLNDIELKSIGLKTSNELNKLKKEVYSNIIFNIKNLTITYKEKDDGNEMYISNLNELLNYEIIEAENNTYINSHKFNKIELAKNYEKFKKYGNINNNLLKLMYNYKNLSLNTYDNQFNGINKDELKEYLNSKFNLSYSSMNDYYKCAFKYYLNNILKINIYEEKFSTVLGNIFHRILEQTFKNNKSIDDLWKLEKEEIDKLELRDKFFINNLKEELNIIINTIKKHNSLSKLNESMYEQKIEIPFSSEYNVTFKGFIDKINYLKEDQETLISIIDYKTGNANINLENIKYGLDMQLPIYIFLIKNSNIFENVRIAGIYIHQLLETPYKNDNKKIIEKQNKNLKLKGYSNQDREVLNKIDESFEDSNMINNLKITSNGFYQYAKLLNDEEFEKLNIIAKEKIEEAIDKISAGEFNINPKKIDSKTDTCQYCEYQSICYKKEANYIMINKEEGDSENAMD